MEITIANRKIGDGHPAFIVAELSGNHHQKYEEAVGLVKAAKAAGADAVKLQTYTPDTITLNSDKEWFRVGGEENPEDWKGKTLYELYQTAYTPWEWQPKLKQLADELGLVLFSTPLDGTAVDFLEKMDVPCYKIASYEATDAVLLKKVAGTHKPVILSIGYASREEAEEAVQTLRQHGAGEVAVLHCVTGYSEVPQLDAMNLRTIRDIRERFGVVSGFSDNNAGIDVPVTAVAAGAAIVEKHLILDRALGGPDARFSVDPREFAEMVRRIRDVEKMLGRVHYGAVNSIEEYNRRWRRSLFVAKDVKKGEVFTAENVRDVRPAFGLPTKHYEEVLGKRAAQDIEFGTPLTWDLIER